LDQRTTDILDAATNLIAVHDDWANNTGSEIPPTAALEEAAETFIDVCEAGDIPGRCRELIAHACAFAGRWRNYTTGGWLPNGMPKPEVWTALANVRHALKGAQEYEAKEPEPVRLLREQKVTDHQIAYHIWGHRGQGPFVKPNGSPDTKKLDEESAKPGTHTKNWVHPEQQERMQVVSADALNKLRAAAASRPGRRVEEPATIEQLIDDGCNVEQIAQLKRVTPEEVRRVARKTGRTVPELENVNALRSPHEPTHDLDHLPGGTTTQQQPNDPPEGQSLDDVILETSDELGEEAEAGMIAELVSEKTGDKVTPQKVAAVLRKSRQTA